VPLQWLSRTFETISCSKMLICRRLYIVGRGPLSPGSVGQKVMSELRNNVLGKESSRTDYSKEYHKFARGIELEG